MSLTKAATVIRILLGLLFLTTGVMKFAVPDLRAAFSGQLTVAGIPFHSFNMWVVPAMEISLGVLFLLGLLPRLTGLSAIALMVVAAYVHLAVNDPALFPLQPQEPVIPAFVIGLSILFLWLKNGSLSLNVARLPAFGKEPGATTQTRGA